MSQLTATDWVLAAVRQLGAAGVDHVKVEPLAKQLGVSKGSFYWHFANRDALLAAILDLWESLGTEAIIAEVEDESAAPDDRIWNLIQRTFGQPQFDGVELGIRAWASSDPTARAVVDRVDLRRTTYVKGLLVAAGVDNDTAASRTAVMYRTLIGEFVLRSHQSQPLPPATLRFLARSLVAPRDE